MALEVGHIFNPTKLFELRPGRAERGGKERRKEGIRHRPGREPRAKRIRTKKDHIPGGNGSYSLRVLGVSTGREQSLKKTFQRARWTGEWSNETAAG